jgi:hypothetical protein
MPDERDLTGTGVFSASSEGQESPSYWNSASPPPAWMAISFSSPVTITAVRATVEQNPNGQTRHQVLATLADNSDFTIVNWAGNTVDGQVLIVRSDPPIENVIKVTLNTIASPSWVAWRDFQISGY